MGCATVMNPPLLERPTPSTTPASPGWDVTAVFRIMNRERAVWESRGAQAAFKPHLRDAPWARTTFFSISSCFRRRFLLFFISERKDFIPASRRGNKIPSQLEIWITKLASFCSDQFRWAADFRMIQCIFKYINPVGNKDNDSSLDLKRKILFKYR